MCACVCVCVCVHACVRVCAFSKWLSLVCGLSWLSHLLSHFSQEKELRKSTIEAYQRVSDECSSGVVRWCMRPRPLPGVCYLCAGDS